MAHSEAMILMQPTARMSLPALFGVFVRIALSSFGGYMAMIAATQKSLVEKRGLLSDREMLDGLSLASALPGPFAINVVAYCGYRLRGNLGALVAVSAVLLPAFVLMLILSIAYFQVAQTPALGHVFAGVLPAVAAIIVVAAMGLWHRTVSTASERLLVIAAALASVSFSSAYTTVLVLFAAAVLGAILFAKQDMLKVQVLPEYVMPDETLFESDVSDIDGAFGNAKAILVNPQLRHSRESGNPLLRDELTLGSGVDSRFLGNDGLISVRHNPFASSTTLPLLLSGSLPFGLLALLGSAALFKIFCVFTAMSLMLFGGAYVFVPVLQSVVVDGQAWLTQQELVDAVAMAQIMPGPAVVVATFIGYKLAGFVGALVATLGIVMPAVLLMLLCAQGLDRIQRNLYVSAALRGIRAAVVGLVFAAALLIAKSAVPGVIAYAIGVASLIALLRYRMEAMWLVPSAGLLGFLAY